tara:strand:+ start:616 stop:2055 length:1440 start_codon:yes stop_codon:yes gene_type:complete
MDTLDLFFKKFSYKFDKGYPDMGNPKDVILLESILRELEIGVNLEETKLSPAELSKDATFSGGRKIPRIEILIDKITNKESLELEDGGSFTVTDIEKVLSQLKGKTKVDKAIVLGVNEDGKTITTSDLKKTADFGGGGGMRGGSELTAQAESAQCIANAIRYSTGEITEEDITDEAIQNSKSKVEVTDFDSASNLLKTNRGWLISSVSIANALASQYPGSFIHNRGSEWVQKLNNKVKPLLKEVGIQDINKWNPADIWMVSSEESDIEWPNSLGEINTLLLEKFNEGKIIGVSLKKADKNVTLKVFNAGASGGKKYEMKGVDVSPSHAKAYIILDDGSKIEFRNFSALTGFMGELGLKKAAGGKVGYSIIKKAFADSNITLSSPNEIKDEVLNEDPKFKDKFEKLWKNISELSSADFDQYYDDPKKTINQKYSYRISKFLALEIINALNKAENPNEIISDLIGYASSQTKESSVFVKAF